MAAKKRTTDAKKTRSRKKKPLKLDSRLNIQGAGRLKDELTAALSAGTPVSIDAGSVESVDTAVLQLLVAFARHDGAQPGAVEWVSTSDAFVTSARLLGLEKHLGIGPEAA